MSWDDLSTATKEAIRADLRQGTEALTQGVQMLADVIKRMEEDKEAS